MKRFRLDPDQQRAVDHHGDLVIPAVPGSGKTAVLVHRVERLLNDGVPPARIACLTFLKKAQESLRSRLNDLVGMDVARHLDTRTYHSIGSSILRSHGDMLHPGFSRASLVKEGDLMHRLRRQLRESAESLRCKHLIYSNDDSAPEVSPKLLARFSSTIYDLLIDPATLDHRDETLMPDLCRSGLRVPSDLSLQLLIHAFQAVDRNKLQSRWLTFDDMIQKAIMLATLQPAVAAELGSYYDHVLVDEYQDTSPAQQVLVELLSTHAQLVMVADDDQCIYSWRRANPSLFIDATKSPRFEVIKLQRNYRSGQNILDHADRLIAHNEDRIPKTLNGVRGGGTVKALELPDQIGEARHIAAECRRFHIEADVPYEEMMVLVRTNSQLGPLAETFTVQKIPHHVPASAKTFADLPEVLDIEAYLRLLYSKDADRRKDALARIYNRPFRYLNLQWLQAIESRCDFEDPARIADDILAMRAVTKTPWNEEKGRDQLGLLLRDLTRMESSSTSALVSKILTDSHYEDWAMSDGDEQDNFRLDNIRRVAEMSDRHSRPEEFLSLLNSMRRSNVRRGRREEGVTLSTVHRAKGLEADVVFVSGCKPGYMPHALSAEFIDEERRICYVAVTRARKLLVLTKASASVDNCPAELLETDFIEEMGVTCQPMVLAAS